MLPPKRAADRPDSREAARPWIHGDPDVPRRARLDGSGGHVVLEEHAASADGVTAGVMPNWDCEAFLIGADDRPGLADRV
jgi:hypothetical protein